MYSLGDQNFSMKSQIDPTAIAQVLQRKKIAEVEAQQQARTQRLNEVTQTISMATNLASTMVAQSKERQKQDFIISLSNSMAARVPPIMTPTEGPGLPKDPNNFNLGEQQLPPVLAPDYNRQNAVRAAVHLDPIDASKSLYKSIMPDDSKDEQIKPYQKPDGTLGYAQFNKATGKFTPIEGVTAPGLSAEDRAKALAVAKEGADARSSMAETAQSRLVSTTGDKLATAVDPTKLKDYDRLTAGKRLDQFVKVNQGKAIRQQVTEASTMLASMLQGGGRGGVVSEKLIEQLTPSTLKGTALEKLQWLTNNPQSVDQQKFIDIFEKTAVREAGVAEDNIRQQQVEQLKKYQNVKRWDPKRYKEIQDSIGLADENVGPDGKFKRTTNVRTILPDYPTSDTQTISPISSDQLQAAMRRIEELRNKAGN